MKKLTLLTIICTLYLTSYSQSFKGTVFDKSTGNPLGFADIYINGTEVGTHADKNGHFEMTILKYKKMPVTISYIGYKSVDIANYNSNQLYKIYLVPKINEINEVTIKGKSKYRKERLKIFKTEFLGNTPNAMQCDIINENDIYFKYSKKDNILSAFTSKPLYIHNKALGYYITYYLVKFEYCSNKINEQGYSFNSVYILGKYLFRDELTSFNELQRSKIEQNRKNAYLGSRMHFFRMLCLGDTALNKSYTYYRKDSLLDKIIDESALSVLYKSHKEKTSLEALKDSVFYSHLIKKDSISNYFKGKGELLVKYMKHTDKSILNLIKDSVYFDKDGYFDPDGIDFSGDFTEQRIGDLLPYEYKLNEN